jgi:parallel beta-helix repeat protein
MKRALLILCFAAAAGCAQGAGLSDTSSDGDGGSDDTSDGSGGDGTTSTNGTGAGTQGSGAGSTGTGAGSTGSGAGGTGGSTPGAPVAIDCSHVGQGIDYQVGPGKTYENLGDVPFESLAAGDTVRIFYRAQPYHEKLMISGVGTEAQPIRVCGVAGPNGELPIIDGENATTRPQLQFPYDGHQPRGLIIVGHQHDAPYYEQPAHIVIEALEIRNGAPPNTFTDKAGNQQSYSDPAAGIFVQRADDITVRGCVVHDNNNGLFIGGGSGPELTHRVLIEQNYIFNNGSVTDWYEHNVYNEAVDVTYQYNHFGPPRAGTQGVLGANIKERSAGVTIRYNWIEDGGHLIDLVDAQEAQGDTLGMQSFHESSVYGNVMVRNGTDEGSMIHYGGDSGIYDNYRKGTLYFYQNTLIVQNAQAGSYNVPAVFELSTNDEHLVSTNNIYYSPAAPGSLTPVAMLGARDNTISGLATFSHDWVRTGWSPYNQIPGNGNNVVAQVTGFPGNLGGTDPGFVGASSGDYTLTSTASVIGQGLDLSNAMPSPVPVTQQYVRHQSAKPRAAESVPTPGAMGAPSP